jgi:transposase
MPALVAVRHEPNVRAFYEKLLARGKKPLQAIVAVMRKLLHAIYGMLRNDRDFEGEKFFAMGA